MSTGQPRNPILIQGPTIGGASGAPNPLAIWVVYRNPADRPGRYVARKWITTGGPEPKPTEELVEGLDLEEVRTKLPGGLYRLDRAEGDDPVIVESWI